jgi:hypothetical protein
MTNSVLIRQARGWALIDSPSLLGPLVIVVLGLAGSGAGVWFWMPVMLFFALLIGLRIGPRTETELTATQLIEHGLRTRAITWARIQDVDVGRLGAKSKIRIWSDDGATRFLAVPRSTWNADTLDADCRLISEWWVQHRGKEWRPQVANPWTDPEALPTDNPWVKVGRGSWPGANRHWLPRSGRDVSN